MFAAVLFIVVALSLVLLGRAQSVVRGTTLAAPWCWAVAAAGGLIVVEGLLFSTGAAEGASPWVPPHWLAPARLVVAVLALCPTVSLLGAKRPQHRAWQFVVLAFLLVLLVPVARNLLLHPGLPIKLHIAQVVFLHAVALMGVVNWIATRYRLAAVLAGAGQWMLLRPETWIASSTPLELPWHPLLAGGLIALGLLAATLFPRRQPSPDRVWLDFRDQLGLFWAARVMARFNIAAQQKAWPFRLSWGGMEHAGTAPANDSEAAVARRTLRMLLLRFVSTDWLTARREGG